MNYERNFNALNNYVPCRMGQGTREHTLTANTLSPLLFSRWVLSLYWLKIVPKKVYYFTLVSSKFCSLSSAMPSTFILVANTFLSAPIIMLFKWSSRTILVYFSQSVATLLPYFILLILCIIDIWYNLQMALDGWMKKQVNQLFQDPIIS